MCKGCWEEAGSPAIINTKTRAVAKLIDDVYSYSGAGGNAHIVVDDWNLEDSSIKFCLDRIAKDTESSAEQKAAEEKALNQLWLMTMDERYSAMAIHDGFIAKPCDRCEHEGKVTCLLNGTIVKGGLL